jgi:hypothetical protein
MEKKIHRVLKRKGALPIEELNGSTVDFLNCLGFKHLTKSRF